MKSDIFTAKVEGRRGLVIGVSSLILWGSAVAVCVSRDHSKGQQLFVFDTESRNGVWDDGKRIVAMEQVRTE